MSPDAEPHRSRPFSGHRGVFATAIGTLLLAICFQWGRLKGVTDSGVPLSFDRVLPGGDALQFAQRWEAARVALLTFHQFPSWNPYYCGGVALFGDAEAPFPGPLFLLTFFWLPTAIAMNVWMLVHLAVGMAGMIWLVRDQGANRVEQWLAAVLVGGTSFFAHHFFWEHLSFAPFCLLPWILWSHRRSLREPRWAALTGAFFALSVWEGGANPTPMMAVVVVLNSVLHLADPEARSTLPASLGVTAAVAGLLAAPRLIAVWSVLRNGRPSSGGEGGLSLTGVLDGWVADAPSGDSTHGYGWDESSAYVGWLPVGLAIVGALSMLLHRRPRILTDLFLLILVVCLAMGDSSPIPLHRWLSHLPVLQDLRVPSRYLFASVVCLAVLASSGLRSVRDAFRSNRRFLAVEWLVLAFVVADLWAVNQSIFRTARVSPDSATPAPVVASFHQVKGSGAPDMFGPSRGYGDAGCGYHPQYQVTPAASLRLGDGPQAWVEPIESGAVEGERWTPNELVLAVRMNSTGQLIVNQNADRDWHASSGNITSRDGLLAVELPSGQHSLRLWHRPPAFAVSWLATVAGLVLALWWWRRTGAAH